MLPDLRDLLSHVGIRLDNYAPGEHTSICPRCSAQRKVEHQRIRCLDTRITNDGRVMWNCHNCGWQGPKPEDVPPRTNGAAKAANGGAHELVYKYGENLRKVRNAHGLQPRFVWQHRNHKGEWQKGAGGSDTSALLYRIDEARKSDGLIAVVEGEKDVDTLWNLAIPAVCSAHGAAEATQKPKWTTAHSAQLQGRDLVVLNDNDLSGYAHAAATVDASRGVARSIRRLDLKLIWPEIPVHGDVSDYIASGGSEAVLIEAMQAALIVDPPVQPAEPQPSRQPASHPASPRPVIKSSREFVAGFEPPDFLVNRLLIRSFLYALTGQAGAGKTSITLRLAAAVAMGIPFAGLETTMGRVLYLAAENPIDAQMRWIALAPHMGFDVDAIDVFFVEGVFRIAQMLPPLRLEAERVGGDFSLIIIDTGPAFFEGDDANSRVQQQNHARLFRNLIEAIPGKPTVLVNVHPVKNALADNLLPAGGGTFLNEIDGNLTAARDDTTVELHWQGKWRGIEFAPLNFLIRSVTHERLKDRNGMLMPTVISEWISEGAKEDMAQAARLEQRTLIGLIHDEPGANLRVLATKMGWTLYSGEPNKMRVQRTIKVMEKHKLVAWNEAAGQWFLTSTGIQFLGRNSENPDPDTDEAP